MDADFQTSDAPAPPSSRDWNGWFRQHRHELGGDGRALDGGEPGRADPAGFVDAALRVLICRLSRYEVVLPSIPHRMLYHEARRVPGVYADLAFFPSAHDTVRMRADGVPLWLASGARRAPRDFDVVAVSLSVPTEVLNLPAALVGSGLRLSHRARMEDPRHALVVLGGHAAIAPHLHGDAEGPGSGGLVDLVCNGDGCEWWAEFLRRLLAARAAGASKAEFLVACARELRGTYTPSLYRHVHENGHLIRIEAVDGAPLPVPTRRDPPAAWLGSYDGAYIPWADEDTEETLPLSFGCAFRCRFCQEGWRRGGLDTADESHFQEAAFRLKGNTAASDLNLLAADACSVPALARRTAALRSLFAHVSVKSLAVAELARSPELRALALTLEKREFTFGIEGFSARLRAFLGKQADPAAVAELARELASAGMRQLKLFFIVTGREEEADLAEFAALLRRVRRAAPSVRLIASVMPLYRAPLTPVQWDALRPPPRGLTAGVERVARAEQMECRWSAGWEEVHLAALVARAGRLATPALVELGLDDRFGYYDGLSDARTATACARLKAHGIDLERLEAEWPQDAPLPWDDLASGTRREVLAAFWARAVEALASPSAAPEKPLAAQPGRASSVAESKVRSFETLIFTAELPPDDAWRPEATLARGLWRSRFSEWPGGATAYAGQPRLTRFPASSGLAKVSGRFFAGAIEGRPPDITMKPAGDDTDLWFLLSIRAPAAALLDAMRAHRIPYQTIREKSGARWHMVGRTHRRRAGLVALCERSDGVFEALARPVFANLLARSCRKPPAVRVLAFAREQTGARVSAVHFHFDSPLPGWPEDPDALL